MVRSPRGFCFFRWRIQWGTINCCICCLYLICYIYNYLYIVILWWCFCFLANGTALPKCNLYDEYVFNQQLGDPGNVVRCTNNCRFNMLNTKTSFKRAWGVPSLQGFWTCNDVVPALPEIKSVALCYGVKDLCLSIKFHWEMKTHTSLMRSQTVIQPLKNKNHLAHTGSWTWNPSFDSCYLVLTRGCESTGLSLRCFGGNVAVSFLILSAHRVSHTICMLMYAHTIIYISLHAKRCRFDTP